MGKKKLAKKGMEGVATVRVQPGRALICYQRGDETRQFGRLLLVGIVVGLQSVPQQLVKEGWPPYICCWDFYCQRLNKSLLQLGLAC